MSLIKDDWFSEKVVMWPGQKFSLQVEDVLFEGKSDFQDVMVFNSSTYGRVLVLDGVIQLTERDEMAYQEMIVNIPMMSHPNPKNVLIIGGGDGGVLREVARYQGVEKIVMCEIDEMVVNVSKQYFEKSTATAYDDPRLTLRFEDAAKFIKNYKNQFDVVIVDSSDPVGPANTLFTEEFYSNLQESMTEDGVICCQGECMWLHLDLITSVLAVTRKIFSTVEYAYTSIPSYPSGQIGLLVCSKSKKDVKTPVGEMTESHRSQLRFYTPELHTASFVLPKFAQLVIAAPKQDIFI